MSEKKPNPNADIRCNLPPEGWQCSRVRGHDGPCAATPTLGEHGETALEAILLHLPKFHPAKTCYSELMLKLAEAEADSSRIQAIQDHGASYDIYAEPDGGWSLRENTGDRSCFRTLRECGDAIIALEHRPARKENER